MIIRCKKYSCHVFDMRESLTTSQSEPRSIVESFKPKVPRVKKFRLCLVIFASNEIVIDAITQRMCGRRTNDKEKSLN
jgi:hypothetical protein